MGLFLSNTKDVYSWRRRGYVHVTRHLAKKHGLKSSKILNSYMYICSGAQTADVTIIGCKPLNFARCMGLYCSYHSAPMGAKHKLWFWPAWAFTWDIHRNLCTFVWKLLHWPVEKWYVSTYLGVGACWDAMVHPLFLLGCISPCWYLGIYTYICIPI